MNIRVVRSPALIVAFVLGGVMSAASPVAAQHEHHGVSSGNVQATLTGIVLGTDSTPLRGAVVQLVHVEGAARHVVAKTTTGEAGRFVIRVGSGAYTLLMGHPAYATHEQQLTLNSGSFNVGIVRLAIKPVELNAVIAAAHRDDETNAVDVRSGATIVNPRESPAAAGSVVDLLRTVPDLDVNADGHIAMRGQTGVLVLVNGRRSALTGDALTAFLRQMPASALQRVEAGSSVSARHGADGASGFVNLIFHDDPARRTHTRSLAASLAQQDNYMASASATGNVIDALNWDLSYSLSGMQPRANTRTTRWSIVPGDLPLHTDQNNTAVESHRLHSASAGATAAPSSNVSMGLRGVYTWMEGSNHNSSAFRYTNAAGDTGSSATASMLAHVIPSGELSAFANFDRRNVRVASEARVSYIDEDVRGAFVDAVAGYRYMSSVMTLRQRERVLRNDVGFGFAEVELAAGHESLFRNVVASHQASHFDANLFQALHHELQVHAAYLLARRTLGGVRAEAGLRAELDRVRIELESPSERTVARVFPSISAAYSDTRSGIQYRFAYGRRINRPGAELLNPFAMNGDDTNEIVGNPTLTPEVVDQLEFGMERRSSRAMLQVTPFVRFTHDPIRQIKLPTPRGGTTTTLDNLARARAFGSDASVHVRATDNAAFTLAGTVAYQSTTAEQLGSAGMFATARLIVDVRVATNTTAQLYLFRRSEQAIEQGSIAPVFVSEFALTQQLVGDRGRITLRVNDPLRSDRLGFRVADPAFTQESRRQTVRPLLLLFASYAVGGAPREHAVRTERPARIF